MEAEKSAHIHIRVSREEHERLKRLAEAEGLTPSAWIRRQIAVAGRHLTTDGRG